MLTVPYSLMPRRGARTCAVPHRRPELSRHLPNAITPRPASGQPEPLRRRPPAPTFALDRFDESRILALGPGSTAARSSQPEPVAAVKKLEDLDFSSLEAPELMDAIERTYRLQQQLITVANDREIKSSPELRAPYLCLLQRVGDISGRAFERACALYDRRAGEPVEPWIVFKNTLKRPGFHPPEVVDRYLADKVLDFVRKGGRATDIKGVSLSELKALDPEVTYEWVVDAWDRPRMGPAGGHALLAQGNDVLGAGSLRRFGDIILVGTFSGHYLTNQQATEHMKRHLVRAGWPAALVITQGGEAGSPRALDVARIARDGPPDGTSSRARTRTRPPAALADTGPRPLARSQARITRALGEAAVADGGVRVGTRLAGARAADTLADLARVGCSFFSIPIADSTDEQVCSLLADADRLSRELGRRVTVGLEMTPGDHGRTSRLGDPALIGFVMLTAASPLLDLVEAHEALAKRDVPVFLAIGADSSSAELARRLIACEGLWFDRVRHKGRCSPVELNDREAAVARAAREAGKLLVVAGDVGRGGTLGESEVLDIARLVDAGIDGLSGNLVASTVEEIAGVCGRARVDLMARDCMAALAERTGEIDRNAAATVRHRVRTAAANASMRRTSTSGSACRAVVGSRRGSTAGESSR